MKPRAGLYTRVSTAMQKERYSLPAQEALLREYAEKNNKVIAHKTKLETPCYKDELNLL